MSSKTVKLFGSFAFALLISAILVCVLVAQADSLAWLSAAFGLGVGWATGILLAPYQSERERFREYAKLISVFITGYLVAKLDRLVELWFDPAYGPLVLRSIFALRAMVGVTSFLLAAVSTYAARKYFSFGPGSEQPPSHA